MLRTRPESELALGGSTFLLFALFNIASIALRLPEWRVMVATPMLLIVGPWVLLHGSARYFKQHEDNPALMPALAFIFYVGAFAAVQMALRSTVYTVGLGWFGMSIKWYVATSLMFSAPLLYVVDPHFHRFINICLVTSAFTLGAFVWFGGVLVGPLAGSLFALSVILFDSLPGVGHSR